MAEKKNRMSAVRPTTVTKAPGENAAEALSDFSGAVNHQRAQEAFVSDKGATTKRLILDIPPDLHAKIKMSCASRGVPMVKELTVLLRQHYP